MLGGEATRSCLSNLHGQQDLYEARAPKRFRKQTMGGWNRVRSPAGSNIRVFEGWLAHSVSLKGCYSTTYPAWFERVLLPS